MEARRSYDAEDTARGTDGLLWFSCVLLVGVLGFILGYNQERPEEVPVVLELEAPCHPGEVVFQATFPSLYYPDDGISLECLDFGDLRGTAWHVTSKVPERSWYEED